MKNEKRRLQFEKRKVKALIFAVLFATLAFVCVSIGAASAATPPEEAWNKTFGGINSDVAWSVQQTADDGYILAGDTESYGAGSHDFWLVKTDSNGSKQWDKTFGGPDRDWAYSVQQTADGGYILAGYTFSYDVYNGDFWLVKTDSNGNEHWNKTFNFGSCDEARSVQQTADGGYILAGYTGGG